MWACDRTEPRPTAPWRDELSVPEEPLAISPLAELPGARNLRARLPARAAGEGEPKRARPPAYGARRR
jgi:hypothetical protein